MNVLIVVPWDQEWGGVASVVGNVGTQLRKRGHHVWFLNLGESELLRAKTTKWNFPGYELNLRNMYVPERPVKSVLAFCVYLLRTLYQLGRLVRRHDIDIVNIHYPLGCEIYFVFLRFLLRFKLVISVHGADLFPEGIPQARYPFALRFLMNSTDWLVAPSRSMLAQTVAKFPRLEPRGSAIHNAVDMAEFEINGTDQAGQGTHILCVALHHPRKAIDVLIKAFKLFSERHQGVELWLVGDGPATGELVDLARHLDLDEQVKFLGARDRSGVRTLLHRCRVAVLPSRVEPFGIAILEALACRKPVIASAVGGIPEIIDNRKNGILVEPEDPEALCDAMTAVWNDPALAGMLAAAGYETVKERFQWEIAAARYEATFTKLSPSIPASTHS
ncbi:MAG TPA: glycosyltransferase family 4 protein [Nitrospira sp.]|nr:glycosyltransferase family 4 protein [Nitrospira sp.]